MLNQTLVNSLRLPFALLCVLLASCDDHYDHGCYGCGNFTPTEFSNGVVSADFNGDGFADVIALSTVQPTVSSTPSNIKAYLTTAAGAYAAPVSTADGFNPLYLARADLNGEGVMDVVTASFDDGALGVFFNNKNMPGSFNPALVLNSPGASQVAIADMNGDGLPDIVSADFNVSLFVQTSPGTFAAPISLYAGGANWIALGDLNGDGAADVALTDNVGVKVLMHTGAASSTTFAAPLTVFTQTPNANVVGGNVIAIGDVDGDGLNDLVITDPGATGGMATAVYVLLQDPANHGTFLTPVGCVRHTGSAAVHRTSDLMGTGKLDIIVAVSIRHHVAARSSRIRVLRHLPGARRERTDRDISGDGDSNRKPTTALPFHAKAAPGDSSAYCPSTLPGRLGPCGLPGNRGDPCAADVGGGF